MTKVLIVDDDALVRLAVRTILTSHGLELVGAVVQSSFLSCRWS